jgi:hypothetical protein
MELHPITASVMAFAILAGCAASASVIPGVAPEGSEARGDVGEPERVMRFPLAVEGARGLSGLGFDENGAFWTVSEGDWGLIRLGDHRPPEIFQVNPAQEGLDLEGVASLGGGRFALATESRDERRSDRVVFVRVQQGEARVEGEISLDYGEVGVSASSNRGLEGICSVGQSLVAVGEPVVEREGERLAPVFVWRDGGSAVRSYLLRLTTATGKISGVWCEPASGQSLRVFAIERHYEVMRIVEFQVEPGAPVGTVLDASLRVELQGEIEGDPNPEGLVRARGRFWIMTDNWYGEISGPSELIAVETAASR